MCYTTTFCAIFTCHCLGVELAIVWLHNMINKFMLFAEKAPQKLKTIKKLTIRPTFFLPYEIDAVVPTTPSYFVFVFITYLMLCLPFSLSLSSYCFIYFLLSGNECEHHPKDEGLYEGMCVGTCWHNAESSSQGSVTIRQSTTRQQTIRQKTIRQYFRTTRQKTSRQKMTQTIRQWSGI